jgi:hypothetical protein
MHIGRRTFLIACGCASCLAAAPGLRKKTVNGQEIPLPPPEHPRLYLRARQAAGLGARLTHPALAPVVKRIEAMAAKSEQHRIEWGAVHYLASPDPAQGRRLVEDGLRLLRASELPKTGGDPYRATGRMMVTGAMVYDWLYPLLTAGEKQGYIAELMRLAKTQECGYPPVGQGAITSHTSEHMLMRDLMSAGIAVYDEFPELYELSAARFFREHLAARNWFYPGHAYHQGDSYGPYRYTCDVFPLFLFDRMGAGNVYTPEQRWVPYHFLYSTRPDGQRLRAGDTFYGDSVPRGQPWPEGLGTMLTASYYGDGVLLGHALRHGGNAGENSIFEFLWRDPALKAQPVEKLPLSRYFGAPFGWTIARTGWGEDAVVAEMKVNEYNFVNHQHLDAGAFQIYYKGSLAVDSGLYQGVDGSYGSPHSKNYYWRTIAHNSLLVHDPHEDFGAANGFGNDGGQRIPNRRYEARTLEMLRAEENGYRTGEVLAHGFGPHAQSPDYTLLEGDITRAYSRKVKQVRRSQVFLNLRNGTVPAALVVFDRVVGADASFKKFWLLHCLEEPRIEESGAIVDATGHGARGRLILDVLLPPGAGIAKAGGPGDPFPVFGKSFPNSPRGDRLQRGSIEMGGWRVEVCPRQAAAEDLFLTVMQVTDRETGGRWPVKPLDADGRTGCIIDGPSVSWVVLLRKESDRSAEPVRFSVPEGRAYRFLVADLAPGAWRARRDDGGSRNVRVAADSGAAWFEGPGGAWTLRRA